MPLKNIWQKKRMPTKLDHVFSIGNIIIKYDSFKKFKLIRSFLFFYSRDTFYFHRNLGTMNIEKYYANIGRRSTAVFSIKKLSLEQSRVIKIIKYN